jgi:predicted glutamine amidotransferase
MCIIGYFPNGVKVERDTIANMFEANPDGAGIMWRESTMSPVHVQKGFMTLKALMRAWNKIPVTAERAIHCRIATSGKIGAACCHPFPVVNDYKIMGRKRGDFYSAMMHNGVISWCTPKGGMNAEMSDTMVFAKQVLTKLQNHLENEYIQQSIAQSINGSRMLIFMRGTPTIKLGYWYADKGAFFSNQTYKPALTSKYNYGYCYNYGYDSLGRGYGNLDKDIDTDIDINEASWETPAYWGYSIDDEYDDVYAEALKQAREKARVKE